MRQTPLYDGQLARGARMGKYCGAHTAAGFEDIATEYEALHSGAIYDLGWRSKLLVIGPDRVRWLNGMVTNNVRDLAMNRGAYNFLLNAQGRIQADLYIFNRGEHLLIDTDASQSEKLEEILKKYIIMDDVEVASTDEKLTAIGIAGKKAWDTLAKLMTVPKLGPLEVADTQIQDAGVSLICDERGNCQIWIAPQNAVKIWEALIQAGAAPVGTDALELGRIAAGIPRFGIDIRERDLPQETGQTQALNFSKGCYVGQEIVERIHSRGAVHRKFSGFVFSHMLPSLGARVEAAGKEVGEITSVASLPSRNGARMIGLGYIRREAGPAGSKVSVSGTPAQVSDLPFQNL